MQEEHNHQPGESTVWAPLILTLKTLSVMCQANNNRPFLSSVFNSSPSSWWVFFLTTPISSIVGGTVQEQHHSCIPACVHCASRGLTVNQYRLLSCFYGATSEA